MSRSRDALLIVELLAMLEGCAAECERAAIALGGRQSSPLVAGCLLNRALEARAAIAKASGR